MITLAPSVPEQHSSTVALCGQQQSPHILFVEDDQDTRELVQILLRQDGFRVSVTGEPAKVMELLATDHFDALLLDNRMPELTGIELCQRIRSFDQKTPILFCSG